MAGRATQPVVQNKRERAPTMVERLAAFVCRAAWEEISQPAREQLKLRVLNSLGCALGVAVLAVGLSACGGSSTSTSGGGASTGGAMSGGSVSPAGRKVFMSAGCASCHTLAAANATGTVGPNLDQFKPSFAAVLAQVTHGGGGMPSFAGRLSKAQINAVARFVAAAARRGGG